MSRKTVLIIVSFIILALAVAFQAFAQVPSSNYQNQGGTNTFDALEIDGITGDAQVTETAIKIGTGFDNTATIGAISGQIPLVPSAAFSRFWLVTDTDLDSGDTAEVVTVTGATTSTRCFGTITNDTTTEVSITSIVTATDQATVQVSADPSTSGADLVLLCVE